ncbi:MAG: hypothetical protein HIU82_02155 [Proteobacteria bacterium]|nr:hypothetical protein [Pseudomonadota bacterium]
MIDFDATTLAAAQAAFGEQVTYLPAAGPPVTVSGIFDDCWRDQKFQDGLEVITTRTVLNVRLSTLPGLPGQNELFRIRGRLYALAEPAEPDTDGDVRLYLRLASDAQAAIPLAPAVPTA